MKEYFYNVIRLKIDEGLKDHRIMGGGYILLEDSPINSNVSIKLHADHQASIPMRNNHSIEADGVMDIYVSADPIVSGEIVFIVASNNESFKMNRPSTDIEVSAIGEFDQIAYNQLLELHANNALTLATIDALKEKTLAAATITALKEKTLAAATVTALKEKSLDAATVTALKEKSLDAATITALKEKTLAAATIDALKEKTLAAATVAALKEKTLAAATVAALKEKTLDAATLTNIHNSFNRFIEAILNHCGNTNSTTMVTIFSKTLTKKSKLSCRLWGNRLSDGIVSHALLNLKINGSIVASGGASYAYWGIVGDGVTYMDHRPFNSGELYAAEGDIITIEAQSYDAATYCYFNLTELHLQ